MLYDCRYCGSNYLGHLCFCYKSACSDTCAPARCLSVPSHCSSHSRQAPRTAASAACVEHALRDTSIIDVLVLDGGALTPGLATVGSELGTDEIQNPKEVSTKDGTAPDGLTAGLSPLAGGMGGIVRAEDGLLFATRNAQYVFPSIYA